MNAFGPIFFYFPAWAFRSVTRKILATRMPPEVAAQVWKETLRFHHGIQGSRPRYSLNLNLLLRYMEWDVALFHAARAAGISQSQAGQLIEEVNWIVFRPACTLSFRLSRLRSARLLVRVQWLVDLMFKVMFTAPFSRSVYPFGDEVAFDVTACPLASYFRNQGVPELTCFAACSLDHRMAELWGMKLTRTRTIAEGQPLCDFRFRRAGDA